MTDYLEWLSDVKEFCVADVPMLLVGTKSDLNISRVVPYEVARRWADQNNMDYVEVSSKSGYNVGQAFESLTHRVIQHIIAKNLPAYPDSKKTKVEIKKSQDACTNCVII